MYPWAYSPNGCIQEPWLYMLCLIYLFTQVFSASDMFAFLHFIYLYPVLFWQPRASKTNILFWTIRTEDYNSNSNLYTVSTLIFGDKWAFSFYLLNIYQAELHPTWKLRLCNDKNPEELSISFSLASFHPPSVYIALLHFIIFVLDLLQFVFFLVPPCSCIFLFSPPSPSNLSWIMTVPPWACYCLRSLPIKRFFFATVAKRFLIRNYRSYSIIIL